MEKEWREDEKHKISIQTRSTNVCRQDKEEMLMKWNEAIEYGNTKFWDCSVVKIFSMVNYYGEFT